MLLFKSANGEILLLNKHTSRGTANVNKHNESPLFCIISVMKLLYYNAIVWQWCEGVCPSLSCFPMPHRCTPCTFITVAHNRWSRISSRVCSQCCIFNRQTFVGGAETSVWQAVWEPGLPTLQPSLWVARSAIGRASWLVERADQSAADETCGKHRRVHVPHVHRKAKRSGDAEPALSHCTVLRCGAVGAHAGEGKLN